MGKIPNDSMLSFMEAAMAGVSLGGLMLSSEFAISLTLTVLGFLPTANLLANHLFAHDR